MTFPLFNFVLYLPKVFFPSAITLENLLVLERVDNVKRGRGRPKLTWDELVKRDLKIWNISKEIALDRSAWRLAINVPEP